MRTMPCLPFLIALLVLLAPLGSPAAKLADIRERWDAVKEEIQHRAEGRSDKPEKLFQLLARVNREVNASVAYTSDQRLYGQDDYLATPWETARRGKGDCEDIAVLKYWRLLQLGVPEDSMRIDIYKADGLVRGRLTAEDHAVLVVNGDRGEEYVLDNRFAEIKHRSIFRDMSRVASLR